VSEDVADGQIKVKRLKHSLATLQRIPRTSGSPEFDLRLEAMAREAGPRGRVFPLSRRRCDQFMKRYRRLAGIHRSNAHLHSPKYSIARCIWSETHQPGPIKAYLGHKSMSYAMQYLNESDSLKAQKVVGSLNY
jgi:hypothetical protein